jgi:2-iminobutanoate/2-iminopropanoate deaminase
MKRETIRVEPLATFLDKYKAPASTVTKHGDTIYVSGAPPSQRPSCADLHQCPSLERRLRHRGGLGGGGLRQAAPS